MKQVIFYETQSEFIGIAIKLIEKFYKTNEKVLFLCDSEDEVAFYNSKLWTFSKLQFIPSGNKNTTSRENAINCHTWFSTEIEFPNEPSVLMHNSLDLSNSHGIDRFDKIIDVVPEGKKNRIHAASVFYRGLGFTEQKLWVQDGASWKQLEVE